MAEVELPERRTKLSKTYRLDNGLLRLEMGGSHSHVFKNGQYVTVNNTLDNETGTDPDTGFPYDISNHSSAHPFYIKFGKTSPAYFKMRDVDTGKMAVFKPRDCTVHPDHTTVGNRVTVVDVWPGIDLYIDLLDSGVKTNYLIKNGDGQRIVEYDVTLNSPDFKMSAPWYKVGPDLVVVPVGLVNNRLSFDFTNVPIGTLVDPSVTLQPSSAPGMESAYLQQSSPNTNNNGTLYPYVVGGTFSGTPYRSIFRFDLSSITGPVTVSSATLSLFYIFSGFGSTRTVTIYRVLRNWVEAEATYNNYKSGTGWGTGGCRQADTDLSSSASATTDVPHPADNAFHDFTGAQLNTDIENMINGSYTNNGWILDDDSIYGVQFDGYKTSTASQRPKLTIVYSVLGTGYGNLMTMGVG